MSWLLLYDAKRDRDIVIKVIILQFEMLKLWVKDLTQGGLFLKNGWQHRRYFQYQRLQERL